MNQKKGQEKQTEKNADTAIDMVMGTEEASAIWKISQSYIKALCQQGRVQARLIGKQWILNRDQPNPKQTKNAEKM